jgi:hypothetical protein
VQKSESPANKILIPCCTRISECCAFRYSTQHHSIQNFLLVILDTRIHTTFMTDHCSVVLLLLLLFTRKKRITMHQHPHELIIGATATASSKNPSPTLLMSYHQSVMSWSPSPSCLPTRQMCLAQKCIFLCPWEHCFTHQPNRGGPLVSSQLIPLRWLPIQRSLMMPP